MSEIRCPKCGQVFTVNEDDYAAILNQVRTHELEEEVSSRVKVVKESVSKDAELTLTRVVSEKDRKIAELTEQINSIKNNAALETDNKVAQAQAEKDKVISELELKVQSLESAAESIKNEHKAEKEADSKEAELKLSKAVSEKDQKIAELTEQINSIKNNAALETDNKVAQAQAEKDKVISELEMKIHSLESDAKNAETKFEIAKVNALIEQKTEYDSKLSQAKETITKYQGEIADRDSQLKNMELQKELDIQKAVAVVEKQRDEQKSAYEKEIGERNTSLEYYKDLKTKMSTKMIGETLEQHCEQSFDMYLRPALPRNIYFEKDNDDSSGSKGDFVYREADENGNEIISIMFEMKNEMDTTEKKHKNSDFFAKLDKDRKTKKCEYAVLVSMLEADSELYNQGIVDVSYQFEKMYVIRPQFFIPMITILRNTAMNSLEYKQELANIRNQDIDITHFEEKIEAFKSGFARNYDLAGRQFNTAIEEIDKTIDHLNKVKENLKKSLDNIRLANDKAQKQLTIKSLTKDNPTMSQMFDDLNQTDEGSV